MSQPSIVLHDIGLKFPKQRGLIRLLLGLFKKQNQMNSLLLTEFLLKSKKVKWLASSGEMGQESQPFFE